MSAGWEVGDLALCVSNGPNPDHWLGDTGGPHKGAVSTVTSVEYCPEEDGYPEGIWLGFAEYGASVFFHAGFRKVTPPAADEFDRETIELMNRAPAKEPVA